MSGAVVSSADWPAPDPDLTRAIIRPQDQGYSAKRSVYTRAGRPSMIVAATTEADVQHAVRYAAEVRRTTGTRVPLSVRSGGHGLSGSGTNDGGIMIDLSGLSRIDAPDPTTGRFHAQAGARWGDVAPALAPHDRALTSGNVGGTGVAGIATAGGIGYFARSQGLTLDHVRAIRVVTADGNIQWVDETRDPELFWAMRGGATQGGIAVEHVLEAPKLETASGNADIVYQEVQYLVDHLPAFVRDWGEWIGGAPRNAESFLMLQRTRDGRTVVRAQNAWSGDDVDAAQLVLEAALTLGSVLDQQASLGTYQRLMPRSGNVHSGQQQIQLRNALVDHADLDLGVAFDTALNHPATMLAELRSLGGAMSDVPAEATAWAGRHQEAFAATWANPLGDDTVDASFAPVRALSTGVYGAYSSDARPAEAERAWPGETGAQLRRVADRVDPDRLFDQGLVLAREPEAR